MGWHGVKANGSAKTVVVEAGAEGWGTEGGLEDKNDGKLSAKKGASACGGGRGWGHGGRRSS